MDSALLRLKGEGLNQAKEQAGNKTKQSRTIPTSKMLPRFTSYAVRYALISTFYFVASTTHVALAFSARAAPSVVCVGETLYDSLPEALFLGGAVTNVAVHLSSLGVGAAVASCVGNDQLGKEARRRLETRNVDTSLMQMDDDLGTGMVVATLDEKGDASYEFDTPAAWDGLQLSNGLKDAVSSASVVVMGTIACRLGSSDGATSAATISAIRNTAKEDSVVMDIDLRPPWYEAGDVLALCRGDANDAAELAMLKLNEEELPIVESWCGLQPSNDGLFGDAIQQRMKALGSAVNAKRVCVTRGDSGATLYCRQGDVFVENGGYSCESQPGSDTVGAGDSFLAALIRYLLLEEEPADQALERACALGAYVANVRGAVPSHVGAPEILRQIFSKQ